METNSVDAWAKFAESGKISDYLNYKNIFSSKSKFDGIYFESIINKTIKKVSDDIETLKYNTAISELMKLVNEYYAVESISKDDYTVLLTLLYPFAPHITEELNEKIGNSPICKSSWPKYDEAKTIDETKEIAVQVNGKVRGTITINVNDSEDTIKEMALNEENVKRHTEGKDIVKVIVIKGKIVNIVVK